MLLPKFNFYEPKTQGEALSIMNEYGLKAKLIAGGTDLLANMKRKLLSPDALVGISEIEEFKNLEISDKTIKIGSCFTVSAIAESAVIEKKISALAVGARALGTPLIRNLATIGGNLGSARPAADIPPSLIAYNAKAVLKSVSGERTVLLDKFFKGPGFTEIQPNEILTEIIIDIPDGYYGAGYINLGIRKAQDCNIVNVASFVSLDEPNGVINSARIVMGCVGPTHLRANAAENILIGNKPSEKLFQEAAKIAESECKPIDDFRASAVYKKAMIRVLTKRTLDIAVKEASLK
ncbi:MAG: xanthine dehydrogenase family protein subunit M [Deltaproteobacteria bacterium]|nr:xanthine dehydrogenase family protein subunit M [Deltaproteobacteria bacterium]